MEEQRKAGRPVGYATCLTPVTSFHCWNRSCKMARYSLARKRCLRGWKCPAMGAISRKKALCLFGGLEPPHLLFTQSRGLVRIFRPVVQPFGLAVLYARQNLAFGRRIALQFIGDDHAWDVLEPYAELAEKTFGGFLVASALHQDIQYIAVLVHCSPKVMSLTTDREEDLV